MTTANLPFSCWLHPDEHGLKARATRIFVLVCQGHPRELAKERIVIFSTHIVEDISSTCHDLAVLDKGRLQYRGSPEEMQERAKGKVFEAMISDDEFNKWRNEVRVVQHSKVNGNIRIRFLSEVAIGGLDAKSVEPSLEDAYVYLLQGK